MFTVHTASFHMVNRQKPTSGSAKSETAASSPITKARERGEKERGQNRKKHFFKNLVRTKNSLPRSRVLLYFSKICQERESLWLKGSPISLGKALMNVENDDSSEMKERE